MSRGKKNVEAHRDSQYGLFGSLCVFLGGGGLITSWWLGSIMPVLIIGVGLFCTLSFMNGLS